MPRLPVIQAVLSTAIACGGEVWVSSDVAPAPDGPADAARSVDAEVILDPGTGDGADVAVDGGNVEDEPAQDAGCGGRSCDDSDACTVDACLSGSDCTHERVGGEGCVDSVAEMHGIFPPQDECTQVYSPTVAIDPSGTFHHMWTGGWRYCSEVGGDKIFHATSVALDSWTFDRDPVISEALPDGVDHFNDPTVVIVEDPSGSGRPVFLMYMTACPGWTCFEPGGNQTYGSVSWDGTTWATPELVIGRDNGFSDGGAWSPSAVKMAEDLVYVYYFDSPAINVLRSTMNPQESFFVPVGPAELVTVPDLRLNVDVVRAPDGVFEMLADDVLRIGRAYSTDGLEFLVDPWFPGIEGASLVPPCRALTGHAFYTGPSSYWIFFGWSEANWDDPIGVHGWRMSRSRPD